MKSHYRFLSRGKQCLRETILAAVWRMEGGLQGSQQRPCMEHGTIEMEMRIRGGHSEKELARTGVDWK